MAPHGESASLVVPALVPTVAPTVAPVMSVARTVSVTGMATARDFVLQLLIDEGIPGYGHRYNLLDPQWTHVACSGEVCKGMAWWLQEFGSKK